MAKAAWNYLEEIRDRLIELIDVRCAAQATPFVAIGNRSQRADPGRRPRPTARPAAGLAHEFPSVVVRHGDVRGEAFEATRSDAHEIDPDGSPDEFEVEADFAAIVTHAAENDGANSRADLELEQAWRDGGRQLAIPGAPTEEELSDEGEPTGRTVNSTRLKYVVGWGPIEVRRRTRRVRKATRQQTRITITVRAVIYASELSS